MQIRCNRLFEMFNTDQIGYVLTKNNTKYIYSSSSGLIRAANNEEMFSFPATIFWKPPKNVLPSGSYCVLSNDLAEIIGEYDIEQGTWIKPDVKTVLELFQCKQYVPHGDISDDFENLIKIANKISELQSLSLISLREEQFKTYKKIRQTLYANNLRVEN